MMKSGCFARAMALGAMTLGAIAPAASAVPIAGREVPSPSAAGSAAAPGANDSSLKDATRKLPDAATPSLGRAKGRNTPPTASAGRGPVGRVRAQSKTAERARSNAERLRSLRTQAARTRVVEPMRIMGSRRTVAAAIHGTEQARGARAANPLARATATASSSFSVRRAQPAAAAAIRGSSVGGAHAAAAGRLGGPANRTARSGVLDGTQVRRKY